MPAHSDPRPQERLRFVLDEQERERSELAHELHEQVAQALAAVLLGLDSLASAAERGNAATNIPALRAHVAETLEHCRALAVELRPPLLDQLGLVPALEQLAERAAVERVSLDPALSGLVLGPELRTDVYRVVEAALGAVTGNRGGAVSLDRAVPEVQISVRLLDGNAQVGELGPLEARLEMIGGTVSAGSGELVVRIPIEPSAAGAIAAFPQPHSVEIPDGGRRARA